MVTRKLLEGELKLIGPIFFDDDLNGEHYIEMIEREIIPESHVVYGDSFDRISYLQTELQQRISQRRKIEVGYDIK